MKTMILYIHIRIWETNSYIWPMRWSSKEQFRLISQVYTDILVKPSPKTVFDIDTKDIEEFFILLFSQRNQFPYLYKVKTFDIRDTSITKERFIRFQVSVSEYFSKKIYNNIDE